MPSLQDEWLPSRESLRYWTIEYRMDQIRQLDVDYVTRLLAENDELAFDWPHYAVLLAGRTGKLRDWVRIPDLEDADRLWKNPAAREAYTRALEFMHYAYMAEGALGSGRGDNVQLKRLQLLLEERRDTYWQAVFTADTQACPDWAFLFRVAWRHFQ